MCLLQHLPAASAAPPAREPAVGGFLSCQCHEAGTTPRTTPSSPPRAPPSILGMEQRGARHKGCAKHPVRPSRSSSSCAKAFPGVEVSQGILVPSLAMPTPCPGGWQPWHQVRRHFCFRGDASPGAQLLRGAAAGAEPGAPTRARSPSLTPCHPPRGVPAAPSPRWPHSRRDVLPPRALQTAAAFPRPLPSPPGRRCRHRVAPRRPAGAGARAALARPCQALAPESCSWDPAAFISTGEPWGEGAGSGLGPKDALGVLRVPEGAPCWSLGIWGGGWVLWGCGILLGMLGALSRVWMLLGADPPGPRWLPPTEAAEGGEDW